MSRISAAERERVLSLLATLPLPDVRRRTGLSYITLARLAAAVLA